MSSEYAASVPAHAAIEVNPRARFEILGAILLALFLGALDQTIVGPVLPTITSKLNGVDYYAWVLTAYLVTSTAAIPIYGKLSDYYGRKPMLIIGITVFLIGSAASGLSQTMWQLILFRGIQGIGAGALFPISLAVIGDLFTPAERGKYQGLFGAVFGVAFLVGPGVGGLLTDHLSWNWIFYVNVPVGIVSLYMIWRLLPMVRPADAKFTLDIPGVSCFIASVVPVLIALTLAENGNWLDPYVLGWFGVGFAFLIAFIVVEWKAVDPMIPLDLFKNRTFAISSAASFFAVFGFSTLIIFLPLWYQAVRHESATASGYLLFPFLIGLIGSSIVSGVVVSRTGRYKALLAGSMAIMVVGVALFSNLRADTPYPTLWAWMFVAGIGVGPTMALFTLIVQNDVPFERLGTATSDLTLFRQIGTSVAFTMAFTLFRNFLTWGQIREQIIASGAPAQAVPVVAPPTFDPGALTSVGSGTSLAQALAQLPESVRGFYLDGIGRAISISIADTVWLGVGMAALSLVAVLALKEKPLRAHMHADQAARAGLTASSPSSATE
jgi:EmrB/QacA subfamily drug resistance transporter